jgi:cellulose synthase/poly-beta-1,6-N-acetylglucosamine synthase-like glycosyltransferase
MIAVVLLVLATLAAFYIMVGYPLVLAKATRRAAPPVRKDLNFRTTVSVVMAVHNGAEFLRAKLESLLGQEYPPQMVEIVVVSDASTDATETIAASYADRGVQLVRVPKGGKPAALNAGLSEAQGDIVFFTDVRQPIHPAALANLVANFADPTIAAVTGELRMLSPDRSGEQADMELYWRYELWARRRHSQIDSIFNTTGCIYAMRRSLVDPLPVDTLTDDAVIPLRAFFRGYRVIFDPEAVAFDFPTPEGAEFGRKLRTLAGLWQVHIRMPQLFGRSNRMRLHFLSHKFGRLALPWTVLVAFAATAALPSASWRHFLEWNELALFVLAGLDWVTPKRFPLKRLTSPARTFVSMNAAALMAMAVFVVPPEKLWKPSKIKSVARATLE